MTEADADTETSATASDTGAPKLCGEFAVRVGAVAPEVLFVLERSHAAELHSFDDDQDPTTPERSAAEVMDDFVLRHMGRHGTPGDACENAETGLVVAGATDEVLDAQHCAWGPVVSATPSGGGEASGAFASMAPPSGATALTDAYIAARDQLLVSQGDPGGRIVLVLDTPPNCSDPEALLPERLESLDPRLLPEVLETFTELGIPTVVVAPDPAWDDDGNGRSGVPDQTDRVAYLNSLALAGGVYTPGDTKFFDASEDLPYVYMSGFEDDTGASSTFVLDEPPNRALEPGERLVNLTVNDELFVEIDVTSEECAGGSVDGWRWAVDGELVELCGRARELTRCTAAPPWMGGFSLHADILCG